MQIAELEEERRVWFLIRNPHSEIRIRIQPLLLPSRIHRISSKGLIRTIKKYNNPPNSD
jgi:hypothetical protein